MFLYESRRIEGGETFWIDARSVDMWGGRVGSWFFLTIIGTRWVKSVKRREKGPDAARGN